jgi:6-pyruvoyltetrahydropterin/6-carboxytetrahydropterin synthase
MVRVELCSHDLNEYGFVVDYGDLSVLKDHIDMVIDHKHIVQSVKDIPESMEYTNCFILGEPSTAENLARYFYEWCTAKKFPVKSVGVSETSKTWAYYTPTNYKPITAGTSVIKVSTISGDWEIIS